MSKTILICGSNGIIGSYIQKKFSNRYNIISLSKHVKNLNSNSYEVDLNDMEKIKLFLNKLQKKIDTLIFLVGLVHKKGKKHELDHFRSINKNTLVKLMNCFEEQEKVPRKIIFASTVSVYGERFDNSVYREETKKKPKSPYAITKSEAEEFLLKNFKNVSWILRFAPVYSSNFLLNIHRRTKIGNIYFKVGDGSAKLSLCGIKNIHTALTHIINDQLKFGVYNISDQIEYTYNDILNYQKPKNVLKIPIFLMTLMHYIGKSFNNLFLIENTLKLITDNIFTSKKINQYINLNANLYDLKND